MYKSGLVPRRMAWLGLIGGPLLLFGNVGVLFDWWDQTGLVSLLVIPEFIWEAFLGIYCAIWGFRKDSPIVRPNWRGRCSRLTTLPPSWQRLLALSGVVFAVLFLVGWFASGGDAPDYGASDQDWTNWADDNQWKSRIGAFAMLLAGFVFLHFAATIRTRARGCGEQQLAALRNSLGSRSRVPSRAWRAWSWRSSSSRARRPRVPTRIPS